MRPPGSQLGGCTAFCLIDGTPDSPANSRRLDAGGIGSLLDFKACTPPLPRAAALANHGTCSGGGTGRSAGDSVLLKRQPTARPPTRLRRAAEARSGASAFVSAIGAKAAALTHGKRQQQHSQCESGHLVAACVSAEPHERSWGRRERGRILDAADGVVSYPGQCHAGDISQLPQHLPQLPRPGHG